MKANNGAEKEWAKRAANEIFSGLGIDVDVDSNTRKIIRQKLAEKCRERGQIKQAEYFERQAQE